MYKFEDAGKSQPPIYELSKKEWELIRDGVADIACWHLGFAAAKPDYKEPPQLQELVNLVSDIKRRINNG